MILQEINNVSNKFGRKHPITDYRIKSTVWVQTCYNSGYKGQLIYVKMSETYVRWMFTISWNRKTIIYIYHSPVMRSKLQEELSKISVISIAVGITIDVARCYPYCNTVYCRSLLTHVCFHTCTDCPILFLRWRKWHF